MCVSSTGAADESDALVKDLENWFEDHQQMCRLMTSALHSDATEVASGLDRLRASVDSGQRLLGRLKSSFQHGPSLYPNGRSQTGAIPLSGMNRFDESHSLSSRNQQTTAPAVVTKANGAASSVSASVQGNVVLMGASVVTDQPRMLPSRTYLKKNGTGS
jgi:hypothetical protein